MLKTSALGSLKLAKLAAVAGALVVTLQISVSAQGLDAEGAIDTIVGSDVTTAQENANTDEGRILSAIENASPAAKEVRQKYSLDKVEIIFVPDVDADGTATAQKLAEFEPQVQELRESIQSSAMFYHAVNSHSVNLTEVVALEFDDENGVTIFVNGEEP